MAEPESKKRYHKIQMRVSEPQYSIFEKAKELGISQKMIFQAMCQQSCNIQIVVYNKKKNKSITLPIGFMCKK